MAIPTLDEMEARAQRYLDGMAVNREAMARDVLLLARSIRAAQQRAIENAKEDEPPAGAGGRGFSGVFDDLFGRRPWRGS